MDKISKNRWQVRVAAAVIFLLGLAAGILAVNVYRGFARGANIRPEDRFQQLSKRLQLNADQDAKVKQIFGDTREQLRALRKESEPKFNDIRRQADERLQQVLTPDQWKQFQTMRDEWRQRRGRGGPGDRDPGQGDD
jgi:Spy/CpxP family protein refolding chaperone